MTKLRRRAHYLRTSAKTELPQQAIWFDTESRTVEHSPGVETHYLTFGWASFRRRRSGGRWTKPEWRRFERASEFLDFIEEKARERTKTYIFCHNTSFDIPLLDLIRGIAERGFILRGAVIDAPPTILRYKQGKRSLIVLDTLNIFRMALKDLGQKIGLEKYDMPGIGTVGKEADRYCKRDVEIIMESCLKWWDFIKENDLGGFASTLAGQAMTAFRHRFMHHRIYIDDNQEGTSLSRQAYYGGRVECFRLGKITQQTWLYDFNSMFPGVMRGNYFPTQIVGYDRNPSIKDVETWLEKYCVTCSVNVDTEKPIYAKRHDGKLLFPTGRFTTCLSTPELHHALKFGHVVSVNAVSLYHRREIFTDFVDFFYDARLKARAEGREVDSLLFKILMNSLYGKFGQRGLIWEREENTDDLSAHSWEEYIHPTGETIRYRRLGGLVQRQEQEDESRDSHPAIAAHVTAYARMLLWNTMETAGRENVYYVDTDSLLINAVGRGRIEGHIDNHALGGLKEEATFDSVEIWGPKDYRFGNTRKTKGVKKTALWTGVNTVTQKHWSTLKAHVRDGGNTPPTIRSVNKTLKRQYNKGLVLPSGHVQPFALEEISETAVSGVKS